MARSWRWGMSAKGVALIACFGVLCLVSWVDAVTPVSMTFAFFYVAPVLLGTWYIGRGAGAALSIGAIVLWTLVEHLDYPHGSVAILGFNAATRSIALLSATFLLAGFKALSGRLSDLVEQRTAALRQLALRLSEAEDTERRRLATDLHDGLSQNLSILKLNLSAALGEQAEQSQSRHRLTSAIETVNQLIRTSRTLTFDLHPAMLDHLGLVPTLRQLGEDFSHQANLEVIVNEEGTALPLPTVIARRLFRSIKELLANAARHGQARQVIIGVHWLGEGLRLVVDDDGKGFDASKPHAPDVNRGLGLPSILERVRSLDGTMQVESVIDGGTRVVLEVPCRKDTV